MMDTNATKSLPGYAPFRLAAEWASSVRDTVLRFGYENGHVTMEQCDDLEEKILTRRIMTHSFTRRPEVTEVRFQVPGCEPITLDATQAGALFWSESAVEKFLFPYFASVAGRDAAAFLTRLSEAWYDYPPATPVCAIYYRCGSSFPEQRDQLTLDGMVGLVCLAEGRLWKVPLADYPVFAAEHAHAGAASEAPPARGGGDNGGGGNELKGWTLNDQVGNIVAREMAEFVSGLRGHFTDFRDELGIVKPRVSEDAPFPGWPLHTIPSTMDPVRRRPSPCAVSVRVRGENKPHHIVGPDPRLHADPGDAALVPDSIFWNDGAVEKLMLPYYASVKGLAASIFTTRLLGKWNGVIGKDSSPGLGTVLRRFREFLHDPDLAPRAAVAEEDAPYAVLHLPRSEYVPDDGDAPDGNLPSAALEDRTRLLYLRSPHRLGVPLGA